MCVAACVPAPAAAPSKSPATFQSVVTMIDATSTVEVGPCEFAQVPAGGTIFAAYSEIDPSGNTQLSEFITVSVSREIRATVQAGSARSSTPGASSPAVVYSMSNNHSIIKGFNRKDGTVVHFAYAAWGGAGSCSLRIDGVAVATSSPVGGAATFLYLDDFMNGASLQSGFADAGAGQSWTHNGAGYLFAFLSPEAGVARIDGPAGERFTDDSTGVTDPDFDPAHGRMNDRVALGVAKRTAGPWTFSVSSVNETWGPVLWILRLPD